MLHDLVARFVKHRLVRVRLGLDLKYPVSSFRHTAMIVTLLNQCWTSSSSARIPLHGLIVLARPMKTVMPHCTKNEKMIAYLVKVLLCGSHLLPGLVEQLNADTEKLLHQPILTEEDGMVVGTRL